MKTNDNMNEKIIPTFMGSKIYRYKVVNRNGVLIYNCVTMTKTQNEIIPILEEMFKTYYMPLKIYCNGQMIKRICLKGNERERPIIDKLERRRYKSLLDMADQLEISLSKAKALIERKMRFEWEK